MNRYIQFVLLVAIAQIVLGAEVTEQSLSLSSESNKPKSSMATELPFEIDIPSHWEKSGPVADYKSTRYDFSGSEKGHLLEIVVFLQSREYSQDSVDFWYKLFTEQEAKAQSTPSADKSSFRALFKGELDGVETLFQTEVPPDSRQGYFIVEVPSKQLRILCVLSADKPDRRSVESLCRKTLQTLRWRP